MRENRKMIVADFFGGSGVAAMVANRLGRNFIHVDIGINSIQTVRDTLIAQKPNSKFWKLKTELAYSVIHNKLWTSWQP